MTYRTEVSVPLGAVWSMKSLLKVRTIPALLGFPTKLGLRPSLPLWKITPRKLL
jgi:hypothetical protein